MESQEQPQSGDNWTVYASGSALLSLLGLVGILCGYFMNAHAGNVIAGGEPILRGALVGVIIEIMRGSIALPYVDAGSGLAGYLPGTLYFIVLLLVAVLIFSLSITIASIILPRVARRLYAINGKLLLLPYALLFLGNLLYCALTQEELDARFFDAPTAFTAIAILAAMFLTAFAEDHKKSGANLLLFAFSLITVCAFAAPSPLVRDINGLANADPIATGEKIALILLLTMAAFNLAASAVRLNAKRAYVFDLVRFCLQFFCVIALIAVYPASGEAIVGFFSHQPLTAVLLLISSLGGVVLSAFFFAVFAKKQERGEISEPQMAPALDMEEQTKAAS